jgi:hypothetical protein
MTDCAVQAAHLVVSTLSDRDEAPLTRIHVATAHIFWKIVIAVHPACLNRVCPTIGQPNTGTQPLELGLRDHGLRCRGISATQTGTRVREGRDDATLLREEQEAFALAIEPSDGEYARCTLGAECRS